MTTMFPSPEMFPICPQGYVRHWLIAGPQSTPWPGPIANEEIFRRDAVDHKRAVPSDTAMAGAAGPLGEPWRFYYPGRNTFVEHSDFWTSPTVVDSWAFTEIEAEYDGEIAARLWVCGSADLWVNGGHLGRFDVPRYMYPDFQSVTLPLRRGSNRLCVRLQGAAVRDTRILFGLQILDPENLTVRVPGGESPAVQWLDGVKAGDSKTLVSGTPAPALAEVIIPGSTTLAWPAGETRISLGAKPPFKLDVTIAAGGQTLSRQLEIPANAGTATDKPPDNIRQRHLEYVASAPDVRFIPGAEYCHLPLMARRMLGRTSPLDNPSMDVLLNYINGRNDCSDFALATLLRLARLGLATSEEAERIRSTALAFRYWDDEPGSDAMCFRSENHSLLFHGCQFIAGQMYPDDIFTNTGHAGAEQTALGLQRTRKWLDEIEPRGFGEFLSSTYIPLTVGALLNVVDFSGDAEMSRRASALVDRVFEDLADHAFRGLTVGPQGRVYRNVLFPEEGGTQTLLSWATPEALADFTPRAEEAGERMGDWLVFLASSGYEPPAGLADRMRKPVSRRYTQGDAEIVLHKTPDYIITSLEVPQSNGGLGLRPGAAGYQQHLWQATLGSGCHVFVNYPGSFCDAHKSPRPGYWYGNGVLPAVRQTGGVLETIFAIPDGTHASPDRTREQWANPFLDPHPFDLHPVPFTHAHWPADAFDRQEFRDGWIFGRKNTGFIGLWCSEPLVPWDDILSGREWRASGYRPAWTVVCGGLSTSESFEAFIESCLAHTPEFDSKNLVLRTPGLDPLRWPD